MVVKIVKTNVLAVLDADLLLHTRSTIRNFLRRNSISGTGFTGHAHTIQWAPVRAFIVGGYDVSVLIYFLL